MIFRSNVVAFFLFINSTLFVQTNGRLRDRRLNGITPTALDAVYARPRLQFDTKYMREDDQFYKKNGAADSYPRVTPGEKVDTDPPTMAVPATDPPTQFLTKSPTMRDIETDPPSPSPRDTDIPTTDVLDTDSPTTLDVGSVDFPGTDPPTKFRTDSPTMTGDATDSPTGTPDRCNYSNDSVCPQVYEPVCGMDGVTYSNECVFGVVQCNDPSLLSFVEGECPAATDPPSPGPMDIPTTLTDVDDDDGVAPTMTKAPTATAPPDSPTGTPDRCNDSNDSVCPQVYTPVCGSDGETYSNECVFGVVQCKDPSLLSFKEGECPAAKDTPSPSPRDTDSPTTMTDVLDTDSPTYLDVGGDDYGGDDDGGDDDGGDDDGGDDDGGDGDGDGGTPKMTTSPTATATTDPDRCNDLVCPQVYTPVCGSDGETYSNECFFGVAQCEDPSLLSFKEGECPAATDPPSPGPQDTDSPTTMTDVLDTDSPTTLDVGGDDYGGDDYGGDDDGDDDNGVDGDGDGGTPKMTTSPTATAPPLG